MTKFNLLSIVNSAILLMLLVFGFFYFTNINKQELVYIDNIELFNAFNMTKDIKVFEEKKISSQRNELDSLYIKLQSIQDKEGSLIKSLQQQIAYKSKNLQELQDNYAHNLSKNVWNRLNGYIKEYAKTNNLKIILGTSGNGNVMYAEDFIDVTSKILEFSNQKYEGKN